MIRIKKLQRRMVDARATIHVALFTVLALSLLIVSIAFFAASIGRPWMGVILSSGPSGWRVDTVDVNGLAGQAGIRSGEIPVEINGVPAADFLSKYNKEGIVFGQLITELTVADGQGALTSVSLRGNSLFRISLLEQLTLVAVSVIFWVIGLFVFLKRPRSLAARLMCLCALAVGLALSANFAVSRAMPSAIFFEIGATVFGPWLLIHFFLVLPEERTKLRQSRRLYLIYVVPTITVALFPLIGYAHGQPESWYRNLRFLEYGIGLLAAVAVMLANFFRATDPRSRQQMKIVLIGCIAAVIPIVVLNLLPQALSKPPLIAPGFSFLSMAFIPLAMAYAVVTRHLMDIDIVLRRSLIYGLVSLIMAAVLSVGIIATSLLRPSITTLQEIVMALGLGVVAAVLFGPAKHSIEIAVDKFVYKDRYDYRRTIQTLSLSLNNSRETAEICRLVVATSTRNLNLSGACLFVKGQSGRLELGAASGIFADGGTRSRLEETLAPEQRTAVNEFPNSAPPNGLDLAFVLPVAAGKEEAGILCVSNKTSRQGFSSNDLFLLQGIASVAASALNRAALIRDVSVRDTFVSIASHELNTPLTTILGYSELLLKKDGHDPTTRRRLERVYDAGKRISEMVNDLLNVTRIQSGRITLKLEPVSVIDVAEEKLSLAREITTQHQFRLDVNGTFPQARVDRDKFGQIIWNLLSNAIKYSPNGGVISVSIKEDQVAHHVTLSVIDQGIGIASSDKESLFKTFHRIQRPETVSIRGSGLGLYIVKEWAEAMGGSVRLESELNKGSTFSVSVPSATVSAESVQTSNPEG